MSRVTKLYFIIAIPVLSMLLDTSKYFLPKIFSKWQNEKGEEVTFQDFGDQWLVLTLAYTSCLAICPMTVKNLKDLSKAWPQNRTKPHFILISIDPQVDTPLARQLFMKKNDIKSEEWSFLSGNKTDTQALLATLGLGFNERTGQGHISHSLDVLVIEPGGKVKERWNGLRKLR